jgi:hypothetical protein
MDQPPSSTLSGSSPGPLSAKNTSGKIEMVFRFWGANGRGAETVGEHSPVHNPGVLALIEDAVASKRGVFLATHDQFHVSGLRQPADALVVSRQVQLGLQGFRGRHGNGPVAVSIAIDAGRGDRTAAQPKPDLDEPGASGSSPSTSSMPPTQQPSHDLITLLKLSKPAQILLTHDLCEQVTEIKGLPLKSFPGRFGVYEYLWAAEEKLDLLQSEPQLTLTALPPALSPATASIPAKVSNGQANPAGGAPRAFDVPQSSSEIVQPQHAAFQSRIPPPRVLVFAAVGLVAVGAAIAVGVHLARGPASSAAPAPVAAPVSSPQPLPANPRAATQPEASTPSAIPAERPRPASTLSHAAAKQAANKPTAKAEEKPAAAAQAAPAQAAPAPACSQAMDATRLVTLGEQYRGRGDYANAIRVFREVLACDPNNTIAREGLDKATRGQEQTQH